MTICLSTSTYNTEKRNEAIILVRQTESMKIHIKEPICITKERAEDKLIGDANWLKLMKRVNLF